MSTKAYLNSFKILNGGPGSGRHPESGESQTHISNASQAYNNLQSLMDSSDTLPWGSPEYENVMSQISDEQDKLAESRVAYLSSKGIDHNVVDAQLKDWSNGIGPRDPSTGKYIFGEPDLSKNLNTPEIKAEKSFTQSVYKSAGISSIDLYRGQDAEFGNSIPKGLVSFSTSKMSARSFGEVITTKTVPVSSIISSSQLTRMSSYASENEVIVNV